MTTQDILPRVLSWGEEDEHGKISLYRLESSLLAQAPPWNVKNCPPEYLFENKAKAIPATMDAIR